MATGSMKTREKGSRLHSLDMIRAVAATSVLVTHWSGWFAVPNGGVLGAALAGWNSVFWTTLWAGHGIHPGVVVFIVLSGFCIHLPQARQTEMVSAPGFWRTYARRRALRIGPVYWFAVLLGALAVAIALHSSQSPPFPIDSNLDIKGVVGRVLFVNAVRPWTSLGNGPLDTVASEVLLYAAYPLVLNLVQRFGWGAAFALGAVLQVCAVLCVVLGVDGTWVSASVLTFQLYWVLGAFSAELFAGARGHRSRWAGWRSLGVLIAYWVAAQFLRFRGGHLITTILLAVAAAFIVLDLTLAESHRRSTAVEIALAWLGERSYSLYAVHTPVLALMWFMFEWLRQPSSLASIVLLAGVLVAAIVSYETVEHPSHSWARGRARAPRWA